MTVETVPPPHAAPGAGPYSPAVRAGDWIVCAGQVGIDAQGKLADGVEAQTRQVFANIKAVLGDCGVTVNDIAKATVFVTDIGAFGTVNAVYAEAMGGH